MDVLFQDLRYSIRTLRRDAGLTVSVILIAACGIGASSTVFSVVHALLLRPLPFADPARLVWITNRETAGLSSQTTQVGHMLDLRDRSQTLEAIAGYMAFYGVGDHVLSGTGEPERLSGVPVSRNFFDVLGVRPVLGRAFTVEESRWNGPKAVMLSDGLWRRRFAANPAIIGTALILNDEPHIVVGVLPASFDFASVFAPGRHFDLYFAFPLSDETNRWGNTMAMIGRLRPGVSVGQSHAEVRALAAQLTKEHPQRNSVEGHVKPLAEHVTGRARLAVWVLAGAVGVVMLIVCANLSNLLLARSNARAKEVAIRSALGAARRRLFVQMLIDGAVLSMSGAILGALLAVVGTSVLAKLDAISIPMLRTVQTDTTALVFTILVAALTGIVFSLAPSLQARSVAIHEMLKDGSRGSTEGRRRAWVRQALVVAEIAFACTLLFGAGLLMRSFARVLNVDMGFEPARAATIRVDPDGRYTTPEQRNAYVDDVLQRVRAIPGIEAAGISDSLPLGGNRTWGARAKGVTYERGRAPLAFVRIVSDGYPAAMGITLVAGRDISERDTAGNEPVIMINETLARTVFPGQDPLGQIILNACAPERRIVGVVRDVRHLALEQTAGNEMYIPMRQCRDQASHDLVVRSALPAGPLAAAVRDALRPVAPTLAANQFRTLQQIVDASVSPRRFLVLLLGAFAVFAVILASVGIYALISHSVNQRKQEIGIRIAIGASRRDVQLRIMRQTLQLAAIGMALGAAGSWILARALSGLLFEISTTDPLTFAGMLMLLTVVAGIAGYLPARRAARVDPMLAVRAE